MTMALAEPRPMPNPKGRPKKPGGEGKQVRIDSDLATKATYLAAQAGKNTTKYLSDILRPIIDREFAKAGKKLIEGNDK